jgi:hypothetical protein
LRTNQPRLSALMALAQVHATLAGAVNMP